MRSLFTFLFFSIATICFAQKQDIYFVKNDDSFVKTKDSADFVRIVSEPDQGTKLYNVTEYYKSGKRKLVGKTLSIGTLLFDGQIIEFFESGKRKKLKTYEKGLLVGPEYSFFPNSKPYTTKNYLGNLDTAHNAIYLIVSNSDSLGNVLVADGNGHFKGYDESFKNIVEEGEIKNGKKEGLWKGTEDDKTYSESYKNGILVSGTSTNILGEVKKYVVRESLPVFVGGLPSFGRFLAKYIRYPVEERENNIQGKVVLRFNVEIDGSLTDMEAYDYPTLAMAKEAVRVISGSPAWLPATKLGNIKRYVNYTIPINFTLGDESLGDITSPSFTGPTSLNEFIAASIKYPEEERSKNIVGTVFVRFNVEKDGSLTHVEVIKSLGQAFDLEAVRVAKSMQRWNPGTNKNGYPLKTTYTIPVNFRLE